MASICLTDQHRRTEFFHETILINLSYWLNWLDDVKDADFIASSHERNGIIRAISYALNLGEKAWPLACQLITTFSPYIERSGHWEIWSKVVTQAIAVADSVGDISGIADLSPLLARLLFWQSRFHEAVVYCRRAVTSARHIKSSFIEARTYSNLGYFYTEQGNWLRAEVLCCHALNLFDQLDHHHGQAHTKNHLGILYIWRSQWSKAEHHLKQACDIWQAMGDNNGLMYGLTNLGLLFVKTKQSEKALFYLKEALSLAEATGETYRIGNIYLNIGLAYYLQSNFQEAETITRQAEKIFQQLANQPGRMHALENLGIIYQAQQDWPQAITHLERALAGWRTLNKRQDEIQTIVHLATCELNKGNQDQAVLWINKSKQLCHQYPQYRQYYQLPDQLEDISRRLFKNGSQKPG
ncbi:MAG: tetratricopeptide repeat protein [Anaerolineae bacterium]|nr:tetratricopeptide repeat protein [Anaerolineae bacterium]